MVGYLARLVVVRGIETITVLGTSLLSCDLGRACRVEWRSLRIYSGSEASVEILFRPAGAMIVPWLIFSWWWASWRSRWRCSG